MLNTASETTAYVSNSRAKISDDRMGRGWLGIETVMAFTP